jgi:hypothetical protein
MNEKIFELCCSVCGTKIGELTFPPDEPVDVTAATAADFGFADIRCDTHQGT